MDNCSIDDIKTLFETDTFSTSLPLKSDYSLKSSIETYNSKQFKNPISNILIDDNLSEKQCYKNLPGAMSISMNQMFKSQNTNAPWPFTIFKNKIHRSRKQKNNKTLTNETNLNNTSMDAKLDLVERVLERPISYDGTDGRWIINEKDVVFPLINKDFDTSKSCQYNVSRAMSSVSSIDYSKTHCKNYNSYRHDFELVNIPSVSSSSVFINYQSEKLLNNEIETERNDDNHVDFSSIAALIKNYYMRHQSRTEFNNSLKLEMSKGSLTSLPSGFQTFGKELKLISENAVTSKRSKRAKSMSSAARTRRAISSNRTRKVKQRSQSMKKNKIKYYQQHLLSSEEVQLREALRIIDLDNVGFFPPSELRKTLQYFEINKNDIDKIEHCLPLDEDGHYSTDNLIKLLLSAK